MHNQIGKQWLISLLFIAFTVGSVALIEVLHQNQRVFLTHQAQDKAKEELSVIRSDLEAKIAADIYVASSLSSLIVINASSVYRDWEEASKKILLKGRHLKIIGLAQNDIINFIYPFVGNERALGLNYRDIPEQYRSVVKAREVEEIFIAGPVDLVQGGRGLIARVPVFSDPPTNEHYWGVMSAVIDFDSLFQDVGIEAFDHKYRFGIRGLDSSGESGAVFYGDESVFDNAFAAERVHFPYGSWYIAVAENENSLQYLPWVRIQSVRLIGYPLIILLMTAFITIYSLYTSARQRSLHDELTKLPNRRYFMYTLEHYFSSAQRSEGKEMFALVNIDLDKFKLINDTYGHIAGDQVLIACAERIKSALRSSDLVARMGGDEFLILLPRMMNEADVMRIDVALKKAICSTPVIYDGSLIYLKASVGHVLYSREFENTDVLLKTADERMYAHKQDLLKS